MALRKEAEREKGEEEDSHLRRAGRSESSRDTDDDDLSLGGESEGGAGVELLDLDGGEGGSDLWRRRRRRK